MRNIVANPKFKLLDVFPITTREHAQHEIILAEAGISALREIRTFSNEVELVKEVVKSQGLGDAVSALEEALQASEIYKEWQYSMPFLKDVPNIHSFRNNSRHKNDVALVNYEILCIGGLLPKDQILYRGGKFNSSDLHITDGPISTSTLPDVARWHAKEVCGQIAILKMAEHHSIKAFAYKTRGNQRLKQEFEVLLQNEIKLVYKSNFNHQGMDIFQYDVYAA